MGSSRLFVSILATFVLALAGCGGGTGGASAGANDSTGGAEQSQAAIAEPSETVAAEAPDSVASPTTAVAAPSVAEPATGGGTATGVCELVTAEELEGILGVSIALTLFAGPPDTCDIQSTDGAPLAATVLTVMSAATASVVYDSVAGAPNAQDIGGIGDKAAFDPDQQVLIVLKADKVLTVAVFDDGTSDDAARLELMKQIAAAAAGRM